MPIASPPTLALFGNLGLQEMIMLGALGILLFGKRLPEVGRSIGKGIVEFKKGLAGVDDEVNEALERQKEVDADRSRTRAMTADATPTLTAATSDPEPRVADEPAVAAASRAV